MVNAKAKQHSIALMVAFRPVRIFLLVIGQMPFVERKKKNHTVTYKFTVKSFVTPFFVCIYTLATIQFFVLTYGIVSFFFPVLCPYYEPTVLVKYLTPQFKALPDQKGIEIASYKREQVKWESLLVNRQFIPITVVWSWMFSAFVGSTYLVTHGKVYTHFFNYTHRAIQLMDMDVTPGIRRFLYVENCIFLVIVISVCVSYILGVYFEFNVVIDICRAMANFVLRTFNIEIAKYMHSQTANTDVPWKWQWSLCNLYGLFIIIFAYAGSRTNIVQFVFFCRVLTNACTVFNERLLALLQSKNTSDELGEHHLEGQRKVHAHLFRDHLMIVQLFRMTESLFAPVLLPYYLFQVLSIVLQLYNIFSLRKVTRYEAESYKLYSNTSNLIGSPPTPDPLKEAEDWKNSIQSLLLSLVFIAQAWIFVSSTTKSGAVAAETAMAAFKIVRRNGYITCETKKERNLMHSLVFSFARNNPIRLTAGGYFAIDRALLPALIGTILNYIVAVYTLKPEPAITDDTEVQLIN